MEGSVLASLTRVSSAVFGFDYAVSQGLALSTLNPIRTLVPDITCVAFFGLICYCHII